MPLRRGCSDCAGGTRRNSRRRPAGTRASAFGSTHPGGSNFAFGDGSVKFLKESMNVVVLRKIISCKGGEVVSSDEY